MNQRILLAGIGNIFFGDDAFGVEVARRLASEPWPAGVSVVDFGIRGLDLAYALLDDYDLAILVDATPQGGLPGTLYVIEPDLEGAQLTTAVEMHGMDPWKVLQMTATLGGPRPRVLIVGCEPTPPADPDDMQMGLSEPVEHAIDEAVRMVRSLVMSQPSAAPAASQ